ncbi:replication initiation protein [Azohydromonas caseinilytica]|uniref:Replication initiation protein n=1 Tax=Azohydromonas caseinilytica TaxID=2728836 RepID=A0A848FGE6_9BURK|nr:replication initiation protein [Azohydromonas caseinilytica]NML17379.1 replication initiation protein [Azohydromonas caseinilytica]
MPKPPQRLAASEQYALELFQETVGRKGTAATIADADKDITFKKNNVFIDVGELSLLGRRSLNVMDFLASGAPPEVTDFDCDLALFRFLLNYDSRNYKHMREALRETQKSTVLVEVEHASARSGSELKDFVSISLVNMVAVAGGRVFFQFHPAIRRLQKDQRGYTFLSLRTTSAFSSQYAHALYERLRSVAFKGSPTEWLTVDEARRWAGASGDKYADEFKAFKRRVLEIAKTQINELSDLRVEYETRSSPGSKKVTHIRFAFREQEGKGMQSFHESEARKELYNTLRGEFGLGTRDIEEIARRPQDFTQDRIEAAIAFVRHRIKKGGKKVHAPGKLLLKALEEGWTIPTAELEDARPALATDAARAAGAANAVAASAPAEPDAATAALQREYEEGGKRGFQAFLELDSAAQASLLASFARTAPFRVLQVQLKRAKGPVTEGELRSTDRLRFAFGQHVLAAQKKVARSGRTDSKPQARLFDR